MQPTNRLSKRVSKSYAHFLNVIVVFYKVNMNCCRVLSFDAHFLLLQINNVVVFGEQVNRTNFTELVSDSI